MLRTLMLAAVGATLCNTVAATETLTAQPEYCLFFTVDGLDRDYVARGDAPNLAGWEKTGTAFPDAINAYPTLTTPNMTTLLTGAYPSTTTIGANTVYLKDSKTVVAAPRFNKATTIGEVFQKAGQRVASVQHFMLENRGADRYEHLDSSHAITTQALAFLREKPTPRLMAVLYQSVDKMGHAYGAGSTTVSAECRRIDAEIKQVVDGYKELGILDKTLVVISSDHGMSDIDKDIDVKKLMAALHDGGWKFQQLTEKNKPNPDADVYYIQIGNMNCYFNRPFPLEERERLFATLRSIEGVGTVFNDTMLRRMHAHPTAGDFIVESAPGWWFGGRGGVHGRNTESDGYLMMFGAGIQQGAVVTGAETVDVVPTILHAMHLPIPETVDGKVLRKALN